MKFWNWLKQLFNTPKNLPEVIESTPINLPQEPLPEIPTKEEVESFPYLKRGSHGIDISHHNTAVDFSKIKQDFIFMKATEGKSFISPVHKDRMSMAISKGFNCGSYHYYKPGISPLVQAKHFCSHVMGNMPPVLDIEDPYSDREKLIEDLRIFLEYVEVNTGKIPIIYTGYSYIKDLKLPDSFSKYPLWLAWYTTRDKVKPPSPWKYWTFWQYSESEMVEGIGKCDTNWYRS